MEELHLPVYQIVAENLPSAEDHNCGPSRRSPLYVESRLRNSYSVLRLYGMPAHLPGSVLGPGVMVHWVLGGEHSLREEQGVWQTESWVKSRASPQVEGWLLLTPSGKPPFSLIYSNPVLCLRLCLYVTLSLMVPADYTQSRVFIPGIPCPLVISVSFF